MSFVLSSKANVVLSREFQIDIDWEIGLDAAQSPYDLTCSAVDLVDCISMSSGQEIVPVIGLVDGITVAIVCQYRGLLIGGGERTDNPTASRYIYSPPVLR